MLEVNQEVVDNATTEEQNEENDQPLTASAVKAMLDEYTKTILDTTNKTVHAAIGKRLKKVDPAPATTDKPSTKDEGKDDHSNALKEVQKRMEELEKREKAAAERELRANLRAQLDVASKDKLASNAEELIKREFLSLAKINEDNTYSIEVDGLPYDSVPKAFEAWLKLDQHKGYRAAALANVQRPTPRITDRYAAASPVHDSFVNEYKDSFEL